jgi:hypothetical protein
MMTQNALRWLKSRRIRRGCSKYHEARPRKMRDNDMLLPVLRVEPTPTIHSPMKTAISICAFVIVASLASVGQLQNITADDGDAILKSAKKAAVFIELGTPDAASYVPDFARAKKQTNEKLAKTKLQVVASPADADIVIVVHELNEGATHVGDRVSICLGDKVEVFKGGKAPAESDAPVWSVNEYCGISWPLNRALDKLAKAMKTK